MAFWNIVGFEVTPTTPSSIMPLKLPFSMPSRESESIQTLCPISASFRNRSFIDSSLQNAHHRFFPVHLESLHRIGYGEINKGYRISKRGPVSPIFSVQFRGSRVGLYNSPRNERKEVSR